MRKTLLIGILILSILVLFGPVSLAQTYPDRPITLQITFKAGGPSSVEMERMLPHLEEKLNTKINIVYKAGGGGALGWAELVKQKPDGYFISGLNVPHIILQPLARSGAGYETDQLVPVVFYNSTPTGIAVHKDSPYNTLGDLVAHAKKNPNRLLASGSGMWSGYHMTYLLFQDKADVKLIYIPSKGDKPAREAFFSGKTQVLFTNSATIYKNKDRLRVLAFASDEPFHLMPEVPTFRQAGYEITVPVYRGIAVPPGTPENIVSVLEKAFLDVATDPDIRSEMEASGAVPVAMNSEDARKLIREKKDELAPVVEKFK